MNNIKKYAFLLLIGWLMLIALWIPQNIASSWSFFWNPLSINDHVNTIKSFSTADRWFVGDIIAEMFLSTGRITTAFISAFRYIDNTANNNTVPRWTKTGIDAEWVFQPGTIQDDGNNVGIWIPPTTLPSWPKLLVDGGIIATGAIVAERLAATQQTTSSDTDNILTTKWYVDTKANIHSPTFTGTPLAPTPNDEPDDNQIATAWWVKDRVANAGGTPIEDIDCYRYWWGWSWDDSKEECINLGDPGYTLIGLRPGAIIDARIVLNSSCPLWYTEIGNRIHTLSGRGTVDTQIPGLTIETCYASVCSRAQEPTNSLSTRETYDVYLYSEGHGTYLDAIWGIRCADWRNTNDRAEWWCEGWNTLINSTVRACLRF